MKTSYTKTTWTDGKTPITAARLNKIENALSTLMSGALEKDQFEEGDNVEITKTDEGNLKFGVTGSLISAVTEVPTTEEEGRIYFILDSNTGLLKEIRLNGVSIFTTT